MEFTVLIGLCAILGIGALFYLGARHALPHEEPGDGVLRMVRNTHRTALLGATLAILFSEALLAGSIHPLNELYVSSEGRMTQHLVISFIGFLSTVFFMDSLEEITSGSYKERYSIWTMLIRVGLSSLLAIGVPPTNIFMIAKGLGHQNTLADFFYKLFHSATAWENYVSYYRLPTGYDPLAMLPYSLVGTIVGVLVAFILILLELSIVYDKLSRDKRKESIEKTNKQSTDSDKTGSDKSDSGKTDPANSKETVKIDKSTLEYKSAHHLAKDPGSVNDLYIQLNKIINGSNLPTQIYSIIQAHIRTVLGQIVAEPNKNNHKKQLVGIYCNKRPEQKEYREAGDITKRFGAGGDIKALEKLLKAEYIITPTK